jgi:hypothetical protein
MITDEQKQQLSAMPYWDDYLCFPQPCWHRIYPGKTTMVEALDIIQADPQLQLESNRAKVFTWRRVAGPHAAGYIETSHRHPGVVYGIYINEADEHQIRLKDAIAIYGTPLALHFVFGHGPGVDGIAIFFSGNVVAQVYDPLNPRARDVYPNTPIVQMHYWSYIYEIPKEHPWRGFSELPH